MNKLHNIIKKAVALISACAMIATSVIPALAAGNTSDYKLADINLQVSVPNDLVVFTRNVTSNNAYLDLVGTDDVEELRSLMNTNNIYLEIIPKDVAYEILVSGKKADSSSKNFNELSDTELTALFNEYVSSCDNISNSSVTENVLSSQITKEGDVTYFEVDVKSVSNNSVTVYLKKYYTVMMGQSITYSMQVNGKEVSDEQAAVLKDIVSTAQYKEIKKSIFDNSYMAEITSSVITVVVPIAILALVVFLVNKATHKTKKQISADEERLREQYRKEEAKKQD